MKTIYKADDGAEFDSEMECKKYESNNSDKIRIKKLIKLFNDNWSYSSSQQAMIEVFCTNAVSLSKEIKEILK